MNAYELPEGVWRRDRIEHGWRYWGTGYRRYSEPDAFRANLNTAIREMTWYPAVSTALPLWPGLGLQEIRRRGKFDFVAGLGISPTPLEYPEDTDLTAYLEQGIDPQWSTYSMLGIKELTREGWKLSYFLDRGIEIGGVAFDLVHETRPEDLSLLCALERHDECPGSVRPRRWMLTSKPTPCVCECGCQQRSRRRSADDRTDQVAEKLEDLKPDDKAGTVTHEEPPEPEQ
ncbi:hypothetical protein [Nocardia pseudovaccinii]|uniref:hypothetical protein n=1 Tax=Nocardia pseudovaccinii TaxID=189540 RepID=UPI0007A3B43D|nr:hypothetical protein [Nocardia pseudovaccinii]